MEIKHFYSSTFFRSLAEALISPFISLFALSLGATKAIIGFMSSFSNLANLFSQLIWGSLSVAVKKKSILIIFGGIAWALMWIPIAFAKDSIQLLLLLVIQSSLSAASVPAWNTLLISILPSYKRAFLAGNLNLIESAGSFIGTLLGGFILNKFGFIPFLFYIIAFLGILSRLPFFFTEEPRTYYYTEKNLNRIFKRAFDFSFLKQEKDLLKLIITITFLNFSVNLAAPFLPIQVITGLKGSMMNVGIISAIGVISTMIFCRPWGAVIDKVGTKFVMLACIIPISFIPFVYAIAKDIQTLYLYAVIANMSWAGFNLAVFTYLSRILTKERMLSEIPIYNLFTGLGTGLGLLVSGIFAELIGLKNLFFLSTFLRFLTILLLDSLGEKKGFKTLIYKFNFEPFGILYKIENFIVTYSLVINETLKEGSKLFQFKNFFKKRT
jgi:MFS family permease